MISEDKISRESRLMQVLTQKSLEHGQDRWGPIFAARAEIHRWKLAKLNAGEEVFTG